MKDDSRNFYFKFCEVIKFSKNLAALSVWVISVFISSLLSVYDAYFGLVVNKKWVETRLIIKQSAVYHKMVLVLTVLWNLHFIFMFFVIAVLIFAI